jgi:1-aminocyclopropane-1-carboxylate deaminase/D-cysteine desulfhydrase-like pyridoxal-dependent ACC family enzyme
LDIVLPEDPAIPLLGIYPEDAPTCNEDTCSTSNLIYNTQKLEITQMSLNRGMDTKMWCIYTMEYYADIKKEFMKFLDKWMDLEDIILSDD